MTAPLPHPDLAGPAVEAFLATPRLGLFSPARGDAWERPVPVWFSWDGAAVQLFSGADAPKMRHLQADPRAHLLVANNVGEPERWLSIAGPVELGPVDAGWLESLAARYWDLGVPDLAAMLRTWTTHIGTLAGITLRPDDVRRYGF